MSMTIPLVWHTDKKIHLPPATERCDHSPFDTTDIKTQCSSASNDFKFFYTQVERITKFIFYNAFLGNQNRDRIHPKCITNIQNRWGHKHKNLGALIAHQSGNVLFLVFEYSDANQMHPYYLAKTISMLEEHHKGLLQTSFGRKIQLLRGRRPLFSFACCGCSVIVTDLR